MYSKQLRLLIFDLALFLCGPRGCHNCPIQFSLGTIDIKYWETTWDLKEYDEFKQQDILKMVIQWDSNVDLVIQWD
jgi:hypothetical protein